MNQDVTSILGKAQSGAKEYHTAVVEYLKDEQSQSLGRNHYLQFDPIFILQRKHRTKRYIPLLSAALAHSSSLGGFLNAGARALPPEQPFQVDPPLNQSTENHLTHTPRPFQARCTRAPR